MLFASPAFAIFLTILVALVALVRSSYGRKIILLAASYIFYMWWSPPMVFPLLATTFIDFGIGRLLEREENQSRRRRLLIISLTANLSLLAFFKYFAFFAAGAQVALHAIGVDVTPALLELILPIGISFYTFHTMSYIIDVYRREIPACRSPLDFALFITFFPVLVAGPILRARNFLPQIERRKELVFSPAILMLAVRGLAKKVLVADAVAPFVNAIFADPGHWPSVVIWIATIAFAVQIYCDFSGYSDIARALARMFGFEIPLNFDRPYFARNPSEFWRRWHISLSTWLRDYLYIPLGGSRNGELLTIRNLMLTMLLGGLWHGAGWNFVLWGGMHGVMLVVHRTWSARHPERSEGSQPRRFSYRATSKSIEAEILRFTPALTPTLRMTVSHAALLYCVLLTWIPFRVRDPKAMAIAMRKFILFDFNFSLTSLGLSGLGLGTTLAALAAFLVLHLWSHLRGDLDQRIAGLPLPAAIATCIAIGIAFVLLYPTTGQPFIYFQF